MSRFTEDDAKNADMQSARDVLAALAAQIASSVQDKAPSLEEATVRALVEQALNDVVIGGFEKLSPGEMFGLFAALGKLVGIPTPRIAGPYRGTRQVLADEFIFMAFTLVGTAIFRHRKTGRDVYVALQGNDILIGMYDYDLGDFAAFVKNEDALEWARGISGKRGMPKRKTSLAWNLP